MTASSQPPVSFIDTNIWLYAFTAAQNLEKTRQANATIRSEPNVTVSTQVINEVSLNLIKKFAFDEQRIQRLVASFYRRYIVIEFQRETLLTASQLRTTYHLSYWDSLIVASALSAGATKLLTEDMQDGQVIDGRLTITNPFKTS